MTLNVEIPAEMEEVLRRRAARAGQKVEAYVQQVVTDTLADELAPIPLSLSDPEGFPERLKAWTALHPVVPVEVDDSRESIYEGRGE